MSPLSPPPTLSITEEILEFINQSRAREGLTAIQDTMVKTGLSLHSDIFQPCWQPRQAALSLKRQNVNASRGTHNVEVHHHQEIMQLNLSSLSSSN